MNTVVTKILKMIESTRDSKQGLATRNYINLYYKMYGEGKKEYIEKVFDSKDKIILYTLIMEIKKNRYVVHERTYEKIGDDRIRVMGESLLSRTSEDEDGNITMFDFEGGPCFNVGSKVTFQKWKWEITKITVDDTKIDNLSSITLEIK